MTASAPRGRDPSVASTASPPAELLGLAWNRRQPLRLASHGPRATGHVGPSEGPAKKRAGCSHPALGPARGVRRPEVGRYWHIGMFQSFRTNTASCARVVLASGQNRSLPHPAVMPRR